MYSDDKALGNKSARDKSLIRLLKPPAIMTSRISTYFLPKNSNELCHGRKLWLQEERAGNNFNMMGKLLL